VRETSNDEMNLESECAALEAECRVGHACTAGEARGQAGVIRGMLVGRDAPSG
jgi:hypothetical protein